MAGRLNSTVDLGLDEEGTRQAAGLGRGLGPLGPMPIVRSPARRASATARPLEVATGTTAVVDERLAEVRFGVFEGRSMEELADDDAFDRWRRGDPPEGSGAESLHDAARRAASALDEVRDAYRRTRVVVIVGHGVLLRVVLCASVLGLDPTAYRRLRLDNGQAAVVGPGPEGDGHRLLACNVPLTAAIELI